jgi:hypothetical protein
VHRLEDRHVVADVRARHQAEPAHQARAHVGDDVAEEVLEEEHVERLRVARELERHVVDLEIVDLDERVRLGDLAHHVAEQPVGEAHHRGLVRERDPAAALVLRVVEGEARDRRRGLAAHHLHRHGHAWHHEVLEARVEPLGVLPDDDQVDVAPGRVDAGEALDRPEAGIEVQLLPERDVDAREPVADRRGHGALEGDAVASDRIEDRVWERRALALRHRRPGRRRLPIDREARGREHLDHGGGHLGPDAVSGDQREAVVHRILRRSSGRQVVLLWCELGAILSRRPLTPTLSRPERAG